MSDIARAVLVGRLTRDPGEGCLMNLALTHDRALRILVCGSRDWTDKDAIVDVLHDYAHANVIVLHGGARGADRLADEVAFRIYGFGVEEFPADWKKHGKRAGLLRNLRMLDAHPDKVIAFQRNGSRGTQHTIDEARRRGIPVEVHTS
jgi:hypothetical protein